MIGSFFIPGAAGSLPLPAGSGFTAEGMFELQRAPKRGAGDALLASFSLLPPNPRADLSLRSPAQPPELKCLPPTSSDSSSRLLKQGLLNCECYDITFLCLRFQDAGRRRNDKRAAAYEAGCFFFFSCALCFIPPSAQICLPRTPGRKVITLSRPPPQPPRRSVPFHSHQSWGREAGG